jgi:hypothetical protein
MGQGVTGNITKAIAAEIEGSVATAIMYPATETNPIYFDSVANGTRLLKKSLTNYAKACPDSKIAVFGYSQVIAVPQLQCNPQTSI